MKNNVPLSIYCNFYQYFCHVLSHVWITTVSGYSSIWIVGSMKGVIRHLKGYFLTNSYVPILYTIIANYCFQTIILSVLIILEYYKLFTNVLKTQQLSFHQPFFSCRQIMTAYIFIRKNLQNKKKVKSYIDCHWYQSFWH